LRAHLHLLARRLVGENHQLEDQEAQKLADKHGESLRKRVVKDVLVGICARR